MPDRRATRAARWRHARSQGGRQLGAFPDGALRVEFGGDLRAAHEVRLEAPGLERGDELAPRLLPRADDDRVHGEKPHFAAVRNPKPGVVDPFVSDAGEHAHAPALERQAMDPPRRLAEVA